jgi:hypothetical protein
MHPSDVMRVFGNDSYAMVAQQGMRLSEKSADLIIHCFILPGPVIGFEYNGDGACAACQDILMNINKGSTGAVFASSSPTAAAQHIESFYNFVDIKMAV